MKSGLKKDEMKKKLRVIGDHNTKLRLHLAPQVIDFDWKWQSLISQRKWQSIEIRLSYRDHKFVKKNSNSNNDKLVP